MDVILLGNGFDLNYNLPTKYINFLNTVHYLCENKFIGVKTVGELFSNNRLQRIDEGIAKSYKQYQSAYDKTSIEINVVQQLQSLKNNIWFSYLFESFNKDLGWIDFEKEINTVVQSLQKVFVSDHEIVNISKSTQLESERYIIQKFGFFFSEVNGSSHFIKRTRDEYCIEYPQGSGNKIMNKEKIVGFLEGALHQLAEGLKTYLHYFVENVVEFLVKNNQIEKASNFDRADVVITFNYTNTYEQLYPGATVHHIHGDTETNIILGINPNEDDKVLTANTDFIRFKKYFQRVFYETDHGYLDTISMMRSCKNASPATTLTVMGHSLDKTDGDIIAELFELAGEIKILYHDKSRVASYIANLVSMFGKETFDEWRMDKDLKFVGQFTSEEYITINQQINDSIQSFL